MNRWKIAFWICFISLIAVLLVSTYSIVDQAVTITYMRDGYEDTERDMEVLIQIINNTDLSKNQINALLAEHSLVEHMDFSGDSVMIERLILTFQDGKLSKVGYQW